MYGSAQFLLQGLYNMGRRGGADGRWQPEFSCGRASSCPRRILSTTPYSLNQTVRGWCLRFLGGRTGTNPGRIKQDQRRIKEGSSPSVLHNWGQPRKDQSRTRKGSKKNQTQVCSITGTNPGRIKEGGEKDQRRIKPKCAPKLGFDPSTPFDLLQCNNT